LQVPKKKSLGRGDWKSEQKGGKTKSQNPGGSEGSQGISWEQRLDSLPVGKKRKFGLDNKKEMAAKRGGRKESRPER